MKVHFTCRHTRLTPTVRSFTEEKIERLSRFLDEGTEIHVVLAVEKHRHQAEMLINSTRRHFAGTAITDDLYSAVGLVVDKLEKQLRRDKRRRTDRRRREARGVREQASDASPDNGQGDLPGSLPPGVEMVSEPAPLMSVEEAVLDLDGSERGFVVFTNTSSERVSVLYRRPDGVFGLVEAE
jgi:putative sigma-54 modulation protein